MSDAPNEHRRPQPHPQPMAAPYLEFDIVREVEQLRRETGWQSGHNARTLAKYDGLRIVLIALNAHARMREHQTEGQISIQSVVGQIQVRALGRTFELRPGGLLALDHAIPHDVEALEDSAFLLTSASPGGTDRSVR